MPAGHFTKASPHAVAFGSSLAKANGAASDLARGESPHSSGFGVVRRSEVIE